MVSNVAGWQVMVAVMQVAIARYVDSGMLVLPGGMTMKMLAVAVVMWMKNQLNNNVLMIAAPKTYTP